MNIVSLQEAVKEIARTGKRAADWDGVEPYLFIVGAGVSYPSVPLAAEIQKHCEREVSALSLVNPPERVSAVEQYSYWFLKAYPSAIEQQRYLQSLIENKPITAANLRLAHLLIQSDIVKIVITPNFDDFVSKGLGIFGYTKLRLCDHPETVERVGPEEQDVQIIHVHGTYRYYDLANLKPQIESRAEGSQSTSFTMLGLLDRILVSRSPMVVGYSGWEGDVIMSALHRRLERRRLRYRLFWFCYREDALDTLPQWLKGHADVVFVSPEKQGKRLVPLKAEKPMDDLSAVGAIEEDASGVSGSRQASDTLAAQDVFEALIRELALKAPELVRDPLAFFASQLRQALLSAEDPTGQPEADPYSLRSVVERIELARRQQISEAREVEVALESVRDALRRSQYLDAAKKAKSIRFASLDAQRSRELVQLLILVLQNGRVEPKENKKAAQICIDICKPVVEEARSKDWARLWITALYVYARALHSLGSLEESVSAYEQVAVAHARYPSPGRLWRAALALRNKGDALRSLSRNDQAISAYDEVVRLAGNSRSPRVMEVSCRALVDKATVLREQGKADDALAAVEGVVAQFGNIEHSAVQNGVALAMIIKADILEADGKIDEANIARDALIEKFIGTNDPGVEAWVAWAMYDKAKARSQLGQAHEALELIRLTELRFAATTARAALYPLAAAANFRGRLLEELGDREGALNAYRDVARRFENFPSVKYVVASAIEAEGDLLASTQAGEALSLYQKIVGRFKDTADEGVQALVKRVSQKAAALQTVKLDSIVPPSGVSGDATI